MVPVVMEVTDDVGDVGGDELSRKNITVVTMQLCSYKKE